MQLDLIPTVGAAEILKPLDDIRWTVPGLKIASGAPTIIGGYGYSGKTLLGQEIALCIATGRPVFGTFPVTHGRSLHVDHEQGSRTTYERYQRLMRAKKLTQADIEKTLRVSVLPELNLESPRAEGKYIATIKANDTTFVLIDSLRAAQPGLDENSSEFRRGLDMLGRVSEATGATIVVIHHAGKNSDERPDKQALRGSSAIFDACSSTFIVGGTKGKPSTVVHTKCRHTGVPIANFEFEVRDVPEGNERAWGLELKIVGAPTEGTGSNGSQAWSSTDNVEAIQKLPSELADQDSGEREAPARPPRRPPSSRRK